MMTIMTQEGRQFIDKLGNQPVPLPGQSYEREIKKEIEDVERDTKENK